MAKLTPREAVKACVREQRGKIKSYEDLLFCAVRRGGVDYYAPETAADYNWLDQARRSAKLAASGDKRAWATRAGRRNRRQLVADRYETSRRRAGHRSRR